ncbi:ribbon-helix-helix domain-containing protein [uncultured Sphingomonas sp.]|uniref:ribbon-helix-helix domain-containing protein n=1 Tax=uncultured Sphingomonas sp. TaxID=158754 RepID=UPI0026216C29|nr:ribbon-helix-helix domain-containing protein [uncultured Sphingomonas sp.]
MSRKPSFANLRTQAPATSTTLSVPSSVVVAPTQQGREGVTAARAASREGRKQIAGFFSPDMSFAMHMLARREGRSLQALMAEAFNDVLRKYGESPIGD